ncbi:MAG: hypothetical protein R2778_04170 [Saprospiraceae bacterium]
MCELRRKCTLHHFSLLISVCHLLPAVSTKRNLEALDARIDYFYQSGQQDSFLYYKTPWLIRPGKMMIWKHGLLSSWTCMTFFLKKVKPEKLPICSTKHGLEMAGTQE